MILISFVPSAEYMKSSTALSWVPLCHRRRLMKSITEFQSRQYSATNAGRLVLDVQSSRMKTQPDFSSLLATPTPPELGPGPRAGVQPQSALNPALDHCLQHSNLSVEAQHLIRALLLLWHDHLEPAHELAQTIDTAGGAFVHGIMHRREPDYGNAAYWFRRVGLHPAFTEIARRVSELPPSSSNSALNQQLVRKGQWDPYGFINACSSAAKQLSDPVQHYLREVQRIETESLLDWFSQGQ
jgi:hypothetical protein